jgi:hypothetical protein
MFFKYGKPSPKPYFKGKVFQKIAKKTFVRIVIPKTFCTKENIIPNNFILKYFKFEQLNDKSK